MNLEEAQADLSAFLEEYGPEKTLDRFGLGVDEVEELMLLAGEAPVKATVLLHGCLLGLALAETRQRETTT